MDKSEMAFMRNDYSYTEFISRKKKMAEEQRSICAFAV